MAKKAKRTTKRTNILINVIIVLSIILLYKKFFKKASTSSASTSSCPCATNREGEQHHEEKEQDCTGVNFFGDDPLDKHYNEMVIRKNLPKLFTYKCNKETGLCTTDEGKFELIPNYWEKLRAIDCEIYHGGGAETEALRKCNKYYNDPGECAAVVAANPCCEEDDNPL